MESYPSKRNSKSEFSSPIALGLLESTPFAKNPIEAVIFHSEMLLMESGMTEPPFSPTIYAPLRSVKKVLYKDLKIDGRLIPYEDGFIIELRKDRPIERINFTFAHELAHTFFHEAIPSIKYRSNTANHPQHDDEDEERLCNIAASELLMPTQIFSKIVKDFSPSPESLQKISQTFETSLTATLVKLLSLKLWNASFILWKSKDNNLKPEWIIRPNFSLYYNPNLELVNLSSTSVYHTFFTGEPTSNSEWFSLNGGYKMSHFQSMRLNSKTVLSCLTNSSGNQFNMSKNGETILPSLKSNYICKCDGTGWFSIRQNGMRYAVRCLASEHKKPFQSRF